MSAFRHSDVYTIDRKLYELSALQLWDCFTHNIITVEKEIIANHICSVRMKDDSVIDGNYLFTIDSIMDDVSLDCSQVYITEEHKSMNLIALHNGQYAIQPNNRIIWKSPSLIPKKVATPDLEVRPFYQCREHLPDKQFHAGDKWNYNASD